MLEINNLIDNLSNFDNNFTIVISNYLYHIENNTLNLLSESESECYMKIYFIDTNQVIPNSIYDQFNKDCINTTKKSYIIYDSNFQYQSFYCYRCYKYDNFSNKNTSIYYFIHSSIKDDIIYMFYYPLYKDEYLVINSDYPDSMIYVSSDRISNYRGSMDEWRNKCEAILLMHRL